ncbi:hypothetical protein OS31_25460 [Dickeya oryzae]
MTLNKKTKFSGARIALAQLSAILAAFLPGILLGHFGKDNAVSFFLRQSGVLSHLRVCTDIGVSVYLGALTRPDV